MIVAYGSGSSMGCNCEMEIKTAKENSDNREVVMKEWDLGPEVTSVDPTANKEYWDKMAKAWKVKEDVARAQVCGNCEYFNNTNKMQLLMNKIPLDKMDMDGGGRGYCHKFDFICHNLRTCKAWEGKEFEVPDNMEDRAFDRWYKNKIEDESDD